MKKNLRLGISLSQLEKKTTRGGFSRCIQAMCYVPSGMHELITSTSCGMVARICFNMEPGATLGDCEFC
jgi:hypothetical protein